MSVFARPADSEMDAYMHDYPMLTRVRRDETVSPAVMHFEGVAPNGAPARLSLPRPMRAQLGHSLDYPHVWSVWLKAGETMAGPGSMWAFAIDTRTPEGYAVMVELKHGDRVPPPA